MLQYNFPIVAMISSLVCIVFAIAIFLVVFRDPRAIWIEDGALHFYSSFFGDLFFFLVSGKTVPLDSIAGLSHVKSEFPGAVNRYGIYVELRSGASYKIMTFLLRERKDVVMAHLHVALGLPKPSPEVLHQLKF
jgi:hypothetical protein